MYAARRRHEAGDALSSFVLEDGDDEVAVRTDEGSKAHRVRRPWGPSVAENSVKLLREPKPARGGAVR